MNIHYYSRFTSGNLPPLDLVKVSYTDHCFPRHWDETYIVQVVEAGSNSFFCRGAEHTAPAGSVVLINPGDIHSGCSSDGNRLEYRTMYPSSRWFSKFIKLLDLNTRHTPNFTSPVIHEPRLASLLLQIHRSFESNNCSLKTESLLLEGMSALLNLCATFARLEARYNEPSAVERVKEYIHDNYARNISLNELSSVTTISPYYLLRSFRCQTGQPPHEYLVNVRINKAKHFLAQGETIAGTAYLTGFSDQSHLHRNFKRIVGITPGEFIRMSNFVQDNQ